MHAFLFSWCRRGAGGVPYEFVGLCYLYLLIGYLLPVFFVLCSLVCGHYCTVNCLFPGVYSHFEPIYFLNTY